MTDQALFDPRKSRGRPGPFIPDSAYQSAEALLSESRTRQQEWREICAGAGNRVAAAGEGRPGRRPSVTPETYTALRHLLTAAKRAGETDLLFGVLFRHVPIANHADLATWCRAQQSVLDIYELHYGREAFHVVIRRPGEPVELSEFDVIRLAIPLFREYEDAAAIAAKIGPLEPQFVQGPRIKPPAHVGPEPLRGVVHFAWHIMRDLPGVDRPPEPESVPDASAARRAFDAVIRWCEKPMLVAEQSVRHRADHCSVSLDAIQRVARKPARKTIQNRMAEARKAQRPVPEPIKTGGTSEDTFPYSVLREWLISEFPKYRLETLLPENIAEFWAIYQSVK